MKTLEYEGDIRSEALHTELNFPRSPPQPKLSTMITMADVAARAGVARSTVSHVLSDYQHKNVQIPEATRQRIIAAATELGYRTNKLARSVASGKTGIVAYLVQESYYEPYWSTVLGALAEAEESGVAVKVFSVAEGTLAARVRQCVEFRVSGIIARVLGDKSILFEETQHASIPLVLVDEGLQSPYGATVLSDDAPGCRAAIEHLIALGHSRIAFISSGFPRMPGIPKDIGATREALYRQEMETHGLKVPEGYVTYDTMPVFGPGSESGDIEQTVLDATDALLRHSIGRPTAILCWRDETAMVAIRACRSAGIRVPEDISIVGFSDIRAARFFDPPLSTIRAPWEGLGRLAMQQISLRLNQTFTTDPTIHSVPTSFVVRRSTGPVSP